MDVAYSLVSHRAHLEHRAAVVAGDRSELLGGLVAISGVGSAGSVARAGGKVAFVFPGQGSQWLGMARDLLSRSSIFAGSVRACADAVAPYIDWSLNDVLTGRDGAPALDRLDVAQTVLFAVMVSLAELWRACGVEPDCVIGHSQGEIAAACIAGALSLEDGALVATLRSQALMSLAGNGAMVSVSVGGKELDGLLERFKGHITRAGMNGPSSVILSGDREAVDSLLAYCETIEIRAREVPSTVASHSPHVEVLRERVLEELSPIKHRSPEIPFFSTIIGKWVDSEPLDAEYWYQGLRREVCFEEGTRALLDSGVGVFVEVSPHPVLRMAVEETIEACGFDPGVVGVLGSLRRGEGSVECFLGYLCEAYVRGVGVDWGVLFSRGVGGRVELPTYAFQRKRYWLRSGGGLGDAGSLGLSSIEHPLLSTALHLASGGEGWLFTGRLSLQDLSWLGDHVVLDVVVLPGVVFVELALAAAQSIGLGGIEEITLLAPLVLEERGAVQLQLTVSEPDTDGRCELAIYSRVQSSVDDLTDGEQQWTQHATGMLDTADQRVPVELELFAERSWPPEDAEELQTGSFYDRLLEAGYDYGPAFQGLKAAWRHADNIYSEVVLQEDQLPEANSYCIHPALVDAALHIGLSAVLDELGNGEAQIPFTFSGVRLYARGASSLHVHLNNLNNTNRGSSGGHGGGVPSDGDGGVPSVLAVDANGVPVFSIDTVRARPVERGALEAARRGSAQQELYELQWTKLSTASPSNGSALRVAILEPERQQDEHEDGERQHDERKGHEGHEGPERRERQQDEHEDQEREWDGREGWEWVFGELSGLSVERYVGLGGLEGALERGVGLPGYVVVRVGGLVGGVGGGLVGEALLVGVHAVSECVLGLLNAWLAGECFVGARLVFVTEGALVARDGEVPDLVQAPLVGLLRSAHSEHPERFSLIDIDSSQASRDQLYSALVSHESELAIRDGSLYAPRLTRVRVDEGVRVAGLGLEGTVLVSGGTGGLGAVLARHLVVVHGVRRLLLMSRSGLEARGAGDLLEELVGLGCQVDVVACDVTDRAALERVIARVPVEHPISAVVHTAGVIDDGVISSLDSERLRGVMAPKVDGALNLHELTQHLALSEFILFSSLRALSW